MGGLPGLHDIGARFRARALDRSSATLQAGANTAVPLSKCLGFWDLFLATVGSTVGAGIFVATGVAARDDAGCARPASCLQPPARRQAERGRARQACRCGLLSPGWLSGVPFGAVLH